MSHMRPDRLAWQVAASFVLVTICCITAGSSYGTLLLPVYRQVIEAVSPGLQVIDLGIAPVRHEMLITLRAALSAPVYVGATVLSPGTVLSSSTLLGHALQHAIIILPVMLAGWLHLKENRGWLLVLSFISLLVVEALDVPLVLLGSMQDLLFSRFAPQRPPGLLVQWMHFMNGGGRLALSISAALLALTAARQLGARPGRCAQTKTPYPEEVA